MEKPSLIPLKSGATTILFLSMPNAQWLVEFLEAWKYSPCPLSFQCVPFEPPDSQVLSL